MTQCTTSTQSALNTFPKIHTNRHSHPRKHSRYRHKDKLDKVNQYTNTRRFVCLHVFGSCCLCSLSKCRRILVVVRAQTHIPNLVLTLIFTRTLSHMNLDPITVILLFNLSQCLEVSQSYHPRQSSRHNPRRSSKPLLTHASSCPQVGHRLVASPICMTRSAAWVRPVASCSGIESWSILHVSVLVSASASVIESVNMRVIIMCECECKCKCEYECKYECDCECECDVRERWYHVVCSRRLRTVSHPSL